MGLIYRYIYCLLVLLATLAPARAQTCEWLNVAGGPQNDISQDITVDGGNNPVVVGAFSSTTFSIGSYTFSGYNTGNLGFIAKYTPLGSLIWAKQATSASASAGTCVFYEVSADDSDNLYVMSLISGTVDFGSGISATSSSTYNYALIKFDSSGVTKWVRTCTGGSASGSQFHVKVDNDNNIVISSIFSNTINFNGTSQSLSSTGSTDIFIAKYTPNGTLIRAKKFGGVRAETSADIDIDGKNNYYILGFSQSTFTYGSQTLSDTGEVILKMDSAFNPLLAKKTKTNYSSSSTYGIAVTDSGECAVLGLVVGTANYGNGVTLTAIGGFGYTNSIVFYDRNLTAKWARRNDSMATMTVLMPQARISMSSSYIYFGGFFGQGSTRFGSHVLTWRGVNNYYLVKMDTLGNFLWAFNSGDVTGGNIINPLCADKNGDVLIEGVWGVKITVFNKQDSTWAGGNDMFVAKVSDYSITRGFVSSGPYCAGDTIIIPYTKKGLFKPGNEFIAHLSDSAGNFNGGERELGRVTDTSSGVIKGLLPLFNVASNNKYRIRILSTNPSVESYYRLDTLRLLVYSKDTANAGSDTTLCSGQSIRLGTTGGSRWNWSPAIGFLNPADTANRQPLVKPAATTQYRIIISDSSGCGKIDTDYVVINVRPYINIDIKGSRVICRGAQTKLQAVATGGDSTKYWYSWKQQSPSSAFTSKDSFVFVSPNIKTIYAVTMGDSCSDKPTTATVTIQVDTMIKVFKSNDTAVCRGNSVTLKAWGSGCDTSQYSFAWYRKGDNTQLGSSDTFNINADSTTIFKVLLIDASSSLADSAFVKVSVDNVFITTASKDSTICLGQSIQLTANTISCDTTQIEYTWDNGPGKGQSPTVSPTTTTTYTVIAKNLFNWLSDTDKVTITVRNALSLSVNPDTTICKGETAQLRATATGGKPTAYKINWTADNSGWTDTSFVTSVSPDTTTIYTAILSDGCTVKSDTARIKISVRPPLKVTVNADTIICIGETAELRAVANGGLPASWKLLWKADNASWTDNKFTEIVNPVSTTNYTVVLSDNCTKQNDSTTIKVTVRPPLKVIVNKDTTICYAGSVNLIANTSGGLNTNHHILWKENLSSWTDTNFSLTVSPISTTTYTATLTDNCTANPDSAKVTVTVLPPLSIIATAKDSICQGQTVTLNATLSGGKTTAHTLNWTAIPGTFSSNQNPAVDTPTVNTSYIAKLSDNCSPNAYDTINVVVLPKPKADFTFDPKEGCPPLTVNFTDLSVNTDSIKNVWHILTSEAFGVKSYTHEFLYSGSFSIGLTVGNSLGCTDFINKPNATIFEKPAANFTVKPDIKEVEKELLLINNSRKANQYLWDFGDGNSFTQNTKRDTTYSYNDSGYYTIKLVAENGQGCKDTSTQVIKVHDRLYCAIPSAFTPGNNDNLNPVFQPVCTGVKSYTMTIYNRWGQIIQHCNDCGWDGTYMDKPVPSETYMYQLQITGFSGKKETVFGTVNVVR